MPVLINLGNQYRNKVFFNSAKLLIPAASVWLIPQIPRFDGIDNGGVNAAPVLTL